MRKEALMRFAALLFLGALLPACAGQIDDGPELIVGELAAPAHATGRGGGTAATIATDAVPNATGIGYGGGPVMLGTPDVYYIWYGNWSNNSATTILPDFMSNLGGSPYFDINTTYYDSQGRHVSGLVHYAGSTNDSYSQGAALTDAAVESIVSRALSTGALPTSTNAVYFVLTSSDVTLSGFCSGYCGWHTNGSIGGLDIKYSFVGNAATQCPRSCAPYSPGPNGNVGADGMASVLAHELEESITDPDLNAWQDSGGENGDKCAWKFGTTYTTASGASANMKLGARDYLIQQNFDATTGKCELALPGGPPPPPDLKITVANPADGSIIHAGGALDFVATITDSVAVTSATVNWIAPSGTTLFTMAKNAAGNWELATTLATTARAGTRRFTVSAKDANGATATSSTVTLTVQ
jgi:phosphate-induced protein 1